jgi:hypothetical protein
VATRLSAADRGAALEAVRKMLAEEYVIPEMRAKLVEKLVREAKAGRYGVDDPFLFGDRVTEDMRKVS